LSTAVHTRAGLLSHGQQQWLEIGMLLVHTPRLLLLDEPVAGLTRAERDRTSELLKNVQQRCAIVIVEHDMAFVRQFDARVTVLQQGRVLVEGPLPVVQKDERVIEVYLGRLDKAEAAA
jgi:urea transport system ATP-binding protein